MPHRPFFKFPPPKVAKKKRSDDRNVLVLIISLLLLGVGMVMYALANATQPITVYLDGQFAGTLAAPGLVYSIEGSTINITTVEGVLGCTLDRVFWDRFESRDGSIGE